MVEEVSQKETVVTLDGRDFKLENLSAVAKSELENIQFVNEMILQKNNELQIADSARIVYTSVLKTELIASKNSV